MSVSNEYNTLLVYFESYDQPQRWRTAGQCGTAECTEASDELLTTVMLGAEKHSVAMLREPLLVLPELIKEKSLVSYRYRRIRGTTCSDSLLSLTRSRHLRLEHVLPTLPHTVNSPTSTSTRFTWESMLSPSLRGGSKLEA